MDELDLGATIRGFSPGQKLFGRYTLKKLLGRGGMGVVWQARDESLEQDVAIKLLPEMVATDPVSIRELKRETRRSQGLAHPHILKVHDFVEGGGLCGISMELVEGGTLSARRLEEANETFTPEQLGPWVLQLCEALAYAHTKAKVVHRDLKPANLMLTPDGDLKVADFGIAASLSESVTRVSKQAGSSGTPLYMSPQQMMGDDPAVTDDLYALGATLYELLTGKPPFFAGNVMMQVQNKVPMPVNERRKANGTEGKPVPAEWEETIAACLAKAAADRPQSASEVAQRLGLAPVQNAQRLTSNAQRSNEEKSAGRANRPDEPRSQPQTPNPKSKTPINTPLIAALAAGVIFAAGLGWYFEIYVPEQKERERLAEIAQQQAAERAASEAGEKIGIDDKKDIPSAAADAKERVRQAEAARSAIEQTLAAVTAEADDQKLKTTGDAVAVYIKQAPEAAARKIADLWQDKQNAVTVYRQETGQKEKERIAAETAAAELKRQEAAHPWTVIETLLREGRKPWEIPNIADNPAVAAEARNLAEQRDNITRLAGRYLEKHPRMVDALAQYRKALAAREQAAQIAADGQRIGFGWRFRKGEVTKWDWPPAATTDDFLAGVEAQWNHPAN